MYTKQETEVFPMRDLISIHQLSAFLNANLYRCTPHKEEAIGRFIKDYRYITRMRAPLRYRRELLWKYIEQTFAELTRVIAGSVNLNLFNALQ
jgi:hypothetical protein